jgi:hypothetical protein
LLYGVAMTVVGVLPMIGFADSRWVKMGLPQQAQAIGELLDSEYMIDPLGSSTNEQLVYLFR